MSASIARRAYARRLSALTSLAATAALLLTFAPVAAAEPAADAGTSAIQIDQLIAAAADTGTRVISRPELTNGRTVSMKFAKAMEDGTPAERIATLQQALRLHGLALVEVPTGNVSTYGYAVVALADARQFVAPVVTDADLTPEYLAAKSGTFVNAVVALRAADASEVERALRMAILPGPMVTLTSVSSSNSLLIWDYADNAARLATLARKLDAAAADIAVETVSLKHATPEAILDTVNRLRSESSRTRGGRHLEAVAIVADSRTGTLVLRGPADRVADVTALVKKLDRPVEANPAREAEAEHYRKMREHQQARDLAQAEIERLRVEQALRDARAQTGEKK